MKSAAVVFLLKQQQQEQQTKQQTKPPVDPFSCHIHPLEQIYSHWPCYQLHKLLVVPDSTTLDLRPALIVN